MLEIFPIPALKDNYIWALAKPGNKQIAIVDPGEAKPVLKYLQTHNLQLSAILITHHHHDHTGGIAELLHYYAVPVIMPADVSESEAVYLSEQDLTLNVLKIPGHTLDHVAYYNEEILFCGDTLFAAGCGRVFEGTHEQMYASLNKLKNFKPSTKVYCGHEYTLNNLRFALAAEPDNLAIQKRLALTSEMHAKNLVTLPSTMQLELATNPFLRAATLKQFVELRSWKDNF